MGAMFFISRISRRHLPISAKKLPSQVGWDDAGSGARGARNNAAMARKPSKPEGDKEIKRRFGAKEKVRFHPRISREKPTKPVFWEDAGRGALARATHASGFEFLADPSGFQVTRGACPVQANDSTVLSAQHRNSKIIED